MNASKGRLSRDQSTFGPDLLFVGTQSNLLAYDVERNADAFFSEVQDGVNCLVIGRFATQPSVLAIAGGNCSVLGFDSKGAEAFWTVTGDNVSAICFYDMDNNPGAPYLLVGSDDFEIRIFKNEEMVAEITEADKVTVLHHVSGSRFAYGLANGTVGVYADPKTRLWRVKTKHQPTCILAYDIDLDGVAEIFSGWNNGKSASCACT
jgi:Bardet-Biedl syndrome 2 protein